MVPSPLNVKKRRVKPLGKIPIPTASKRQKVSVSSDSNHEGDKKGRKRFQKGKKSTKTPMRKGITPGKKFRQRMIELELSKHTESYSSSD